MNKRKSKMEKLAAKRGDKHVDALFRVMLMYLKILDMDTGTNHEQVFSALYLQEGKTYEQVALECHVFINTVKRYVKKYDELAEKFLKNKDLFEIDEQKEALI